MTDQTDKRAERLKAALRENLRRRKAQARGRAEPEPDSRGGETERTEARRDTPMPEEP